MRNEVPSGGVSLASKWTLTRSSPHQCCSVRNLGVATTQFSSYVKSSIYGPLRRSVPQNDLSSWSGDISLVDEIFCLVLFFVPSVLRGEQSRCGGEFNFQPAAEIPFPVPRLVPTRLIVSLPLNSMVLCSLNGPQQTSSP